MIFTSASEPVKDLPDDLDVYGCMYEYFPPNRPDLRNTGLPLLIDEETAQKWTFEEAKENTDLLSVALAERCDIKPTLEPVSTLPTASTSPSPFGLCTVSERPSPPRTLLSWRKNSAFNLKLPTRSFCS